MSESTDQAAIESLKLALEQLKRRHRMVSPCDILEGQPYTAAFDYRAKCVVPNVRQITSGNNDRFLCLDDGSILALTRLPSSAVNALASRLPAAYVAGIMDGVLRALFELCASVWTNPAVCPFLGRVDGLPDSLSQDMPVPRGLDYVGKVVRLRGGGMANEPPPAPPHWINDALARLCPVRANAFERTFLECIDFLLLHEIGHVLGGHLTLVAKIEGTAAFSELGSTEIVSPDGAAGTLSSDAVKRGLEIEADAFALSVLFRRLQARRQDAQSTDDDTTVDRSRAVHAVLGATLVHVVFFAMTQLGDQQDRAVAHPPLWFRAREVLRAARYWSNGYGRVQQDNADPSQWWWEQWIAAVIRPISESHQLFGQWLGPLFDMDRTQPAQAVLAEAKAALVPYTNRLRAARRQFSY